MNKKEILRESPNLIWGMLASFLSCFIGEGLRAWPGGQETSVLSWDGRDFTHGAACPHWCSACPITDQAVDTYCLSSSM